jgi:DNA-directed RNA polymerase subunit RPC12/RpoP
MYLVCPKCKHKIDNTEWKQVKSNHVCSKCGEKILSQFNSAKQKEKK